MLGEIGFEKLKVPCIIGCCNSERHEEQTLLMDVKLKVDMGPAALTDKIENTVDYCQLAEICRQVAQKGKFFLLEALANQILEKLLRMPGVLWARIKVCKASAIPDAHYAFVELERSGGVS